MWWRKAEEHWWMFAWLHLTVILRWYRWQWWQAWLLKHCRCLPLHGRHGLVWRPTVIGFSIFSLDQPLVAVLILFGRLNPCSTAISGATSAEFLSRKQNFGWHGMFKVKWFKVCRTELNGPDCQDILQSAHYYSIYLYLNIVAALSLFIISQNLFWHLVLTIFVLHFLSILQ